MAEKKITPQHRRLVEVLNHFYRTYSWKDEDVAKKLGYSDRSSVNIYTTGRRSIAESFLNKLQEKLGVSKHYILTGEGSALNANRDQDRTSQILDATHKLADALNVDPEALRKSIDYFEMKGSESPFPLKDDSISDDQTNVRLLGLNDPDVYQPVKFISYSVWATFTDNFADFDFDEVKTTYPVYLPPLNTPINEKHMVFEIMGDSMEERLFNRDIILTELIDEGNIEYLNSGIYVVAYRNQLVVKRIIDNDLLVNGTLTLHSDNKRHGKIIVRRDDIRYIWRFVAVVFSRAQ